MDDAQFLALLAGILYSNPSCRYDTQLDAIAGAQFFIKESRRALTPVQRTKPCDHCKGTGEEYPDGPCCASCEGRKTEYVPCEECHNARAFPACPGCGHVAE